MCRLGGGTSRADPLVFFAIGALSILCGGGFFAFWSLIAAAVGAAAFGRDLFPPKAHLTQQAKRPPIQPRNHLLAEAKNDAQMTLA